MQSTKSNGERRPWWEAEAPRPPDLLLDRVAVCALFGGTKPINPSTLYRNIKKGLIPRPYKVGGSSRWVHYECVDALLAMREGRR
jgi:predicted DNA-binding transcriptional regulator AlpA